MHWLDIRKELRRLVTFNPVKTESLLIARKSNRPIHPPLLMENQLITETDSHKHLGIYLSSDCTWHKHIDFVKEKAWKRINIMRKLKFEIDRKSLEIFFFLLLLDLFWNMQASSGTIAHNMKRRNLIKYRMKQQE